MGKPARPSLLQTDRIGEGLAFLHQLCLVFLRQVSNRVGDHPCLRSNNAIGLLMGFVRHERGKTRRLSRARRLPVPQSKDGWRRAIINVEISSPRQTLQRTRLGDLAPVPPAAWPMIHPYCTRGLDEGMQVVIPRPGMGSPDISDAATVMYVKIIGHASVRCDAGGRYVAPAINFTAHASG